MAKQRYLRAGDVLDDDEGFDLDVGTPERVAAIHPGALGNAVVMGGPEDYPDQVCAASCSSAQRGIAIKQADRKHVQREAQGQPERTADATEHERFAE